MKNAAVRHMTVIQRRACSRSFASRLALGTWPTSSPDRLVLLGAFLIGWTLLPFLLILKLMVVSY